MSAKVVAVVGLAKEARIAKRFGLTPVIGACSSKLLKRRLKAVGPDVVGVVSMGLAGALAPIPKVGDPLIGTHVVTAREHYACDPGWSKLLRTKLPEALSVVIAGVDEPAMHMSAKKELFRDTGAHAVDMESHIAARFAHERGIPFVVLRVISDDCHRALPPAALERLSLKGKPRMFAILRSLWREPDQFGELLRTGREAGTAFKSLVRACRVLGPGLGCPYLIGTDIGQHRFNMP
jgi:Nucleoside phosphorylase